MAIVDLDGVIAGAQAPRFFAKAAVGTQVLGRLHSLWGTLGNPGAGTWSATLNGANLVAPVNGQLPFTDPVSGSSYLAAFSVMANATGMLVLADRLWVNHLTVNSTALQSPTQPTLEARDAAGTTDGDGVMLAIETSAVAGAQAAAVTVTYTNQSGTTGRTANFVDAPTAATTLAGSMFRIGLQAGDTGVRSVTGVQFSTSWTTGTINLVAYRPLALLPIAAAGVPASIDAVTSVLPTIYDGTVPYMFWVPGVTTTTALSGHFIYTQG